MQGLTFYIAHSFKIYQRLKSCIIKGVAALSDSSLKLYHTHISSNVYPLQLRALIQIRSSLAPEKQDDVSHDAKPKTMAQLCLMFIMHDVTEIYQQTHSAD